MFARELRNYLATARVMLRNIRNRRLDPDMDALRYIVGRSDTCLHIGASDGRHSYIMSKLASNGRIYCFEPSSYSLKILNRAVKLHRLKNIATEHVAVSDEQGMTRLLAPVKSSGRVGRSFGFISSNIKSPSELHSHLSSTKEIEQEEVRKITVDDYCTENNITSVDFIRCDVEGAEMQVCNGAKKTIDTHLPNISIEIHPLALAKSFSSSGEEVRDFFLSRGYRMFYIKDSIVKEDTRIINNNWHDYFFIHPSKIATLPQGPLYRLMIS